MNVKSNLILTISIGAASLGLLIPSIAVAASEGYFLNSAPSWEVDISDVTQKNIASLSSKISTSVSTGGTFRLVSFSLSFSESGHLGESLAFFELREGISYQFKVDAGSKKGVVQERGEENDGLKNRRDVTREIFDAISASAGDGFCQREYESKGIYVSKGTILDAGLAGTIANYEYAESGLQKVNFLPSGASYFEIQETVPSSEGAKIAARYFIAC